jgi:hypothetical protein
MTLEPLFVGICDECRLEKPIVLICMIGCRLCTECQNEQQRISGEELTAYVLRPFDDLDP